MRLVEMIFELRKRCRILGDPLDLRIRVKIKLEQGFMEYTESKKAIDTIIGSETTVEEACDKVYGWLKRLGYYNILVEVVGRAPSHPPIRCVRTDNPLFAGWRL